MFSSSAGKSNVKRTALLAHAAGATGILANSLLIAFLPCRLVTRAMDSPGWVSGRPNHE